jgi:hypothetical protein
VSAYRLDVHKALVAKIVAAQANGQQLAFVAPDSFFPAVYPDFDSLPPEALPALMLMPDRGREKFFTTGDPPAVTDAFIFKLILAVREGKPGLGFLGDAAQVPPVVGLYDFEAAVKNVIETDQALSNAAGGRVQKVLCIDDDYKYDYYPTVLQEITVAITGQLTTRTH